ncbi:MAG: ABC transporter permease [Smithella sp.]|nr:ABC transporter permease [Syntrophaceae bacterium]
MTILEDIGRLEITTSKSFIDTISFAFKVIWRMFHPHTYNSAMRMVLVNQIYFTSVQILPAFLFISIVLGSLLIGIVFQLLKQLNLTDYLGNVLMGLIVTELSPLITVFFITLRSSSAINAEMAVMKVDGEIKTLETFRIDVIDYLLIPRIINGVISLVLLSGLFSIVLMSSGIIFSWVIFGISIDVYSSILLNSADFSYIIISLIKCVILGFFITLIPIRSGLSASKEFTSIPISVSNGMVNVFIAIIIIEVLSLVTKLF